MDEAMYKLLSVLAKNYSQQAISAKSYPCHYGILGDDGPWYARTPRELLLNCTVKFYDLQAYQPSYKTVTEGVGQALGELADLAYFVLCSNLDVFKEIKTDEDLDTAHYEIGIWEVFQRYASLILQAANLPMLNVTVDDLIDYVYDPIELTP